MEQTGRGIGGRQCNFRCSGQGRPVQSLKEGKSKPSGDLGGEHHRQSTKAPRGSSMSGRQQEQRGGRCGWSRVRGAESKRQGEGGDLESRQP